MNVKRLYFRILSILYGIGALLHFLDILDLRLEFSTMTQAWKAWTIFLLLFDSIAAAGLWMNRVWGIVAFIIVAVSQLIAYLGFGEVFGMQSFLITFHLMTLSVYLLLRKR